MKEFSIKDLLVSAIGYKGLPYSGMWFPSGKQRNQTGDFNYEGQDNEIKTHSDLGSILRKQDAQGRYYFLPVVLVHQGTEYEIPNAVISFTGKKNIVETPMVGRKGTVKELISIDDYEIKVQGVARDGDFPETELSRLNELYNINEAVTLKCALTDIFLDEDDKVVVKSVDISDMKGTESFVFVKMDLVTDRNFELIIE